MDFSSSVTFAHFSFLEMESRCIIQAGPELLL